MSDLVSYLQSEFIHEFLELHSTDVTPTNLVLVFRNYFSSAPHFVLFGKVLKFLSTFTVSVI